MSTPERYQTWSVPPQDLRLHHSASQKGEEALKNSSGECVNEWVSESERVSPQVFRQWQNLFVLTDLGPWTLTNRNFSKNWWEARWGTQARLHGGGILVIFEGSLEGANGHYFRQRHRYVKVRGAEVLSSSRNILPQSHTWQTRQGTVQALHKLVTSSVIHPGHPPAQEPSKAPQCPHMRLFQGCLPSTNHSLSLGLWWWSHPSWCPYWVLWI